MKTLPSESELELERTRNIELRLSKFHVQEKDESELQRLDAVEEQRRLDSIALYRERDNQIYARLLESEDTGTIEGVKA